MESKKTYSEIQYHGPRLTHRDHAELTTRLISSAVRRASVLSAIFALIFFLFGFPSFVFIHEFAPELSLWDNLWPRFIFNSIPFFALAIFLRRKTVNPRLRLWTWIMASPLLLLSAEYIHVNSILAQGHPDLYLYVHAAEIYVIALVFIVTAPAPRYQLLMTAFQFLFFWIPMGVVLWEHATRDVFLLYLFDSVMNCFFTNFTAYLVFKLHRALALHNFKNKKTVKSFVGNMVTTAIFEGRKDLLEPRHASGFLLATDLRGFTNMVQTSGRNLSQEFMKAYHRMVSEIASRNGGCVNKTAGDGHLISFGIMNVKKNKLEKMNDENSVRTLRETLLARALTTAHEISLELDRLVPKMQIPPTVKLGAAIDFGEVTLAVIGDRDTRVELDVMGETVIRCTRLEGYTKILREHLFQPNSFLILSQEAGTYLKPGESFQVITTSVYPIRDFPDIEFVFFRNLPFSDDLASRVG